MMASKLANIDEEYRKNDKLTRADVEALFEWLKKQPHLPEITELEVILFLQSCYYQMEAAKIAIDNYFTIRTLSPHIFSCATEDVIRHTLSVGFIRILPMQTPKGYNILILRLLDNRPKNFNGINFLKLITMVSTLEFLENDTANGWVILIDFQGVSFGHLSHLTPENLMALKQFLYLVQEGSPVRLKAIHLINLVPYTEKILSVIKPLMKKELIDMMKLHSKSIETLYDYIPKKCLPEEYQGKLPAIKILQEENTKKLLDSLDLFKWHDTQKVDQIIRSGKPKDINSIFGVQGSFKKIEID